METGKQKRPNLIGIPLIVLIILVIAFVLIFLRTQRKSTIELPPVEIRDYQGEKLSSVLDFRENSIKGPQYVDINEYRLKVTGLVEEEKSYTYDEVIGRQSYSKVITLNCVEGWSVKILWEGII